MEMLISTHLGLQAVKFGIVGLQGLQRQRWEIPRKGPCLLASYPQLSNKHRSLCCLQTPSSWRHWNLGNSYFWVGEFIHQLDSTCTDKPCKIHLQNQNHLSYQILPDPTNISWTLQKPVAPTPSTKNNNISWTKIDGRLPGSVNKSKYQKIPTRYGWWIPTRYGWWIPTWSSGFQIPSGNLLHSYWKWP